MDSTQKTILVVDDDPLIRQMLRTVLSRQYNVLLADSGYDAIEKYDTSESVSALITDLRMPKMSGEELTNELRKRQSSLPVLLLTALTQNDDEFQRLASLTNLLTLPKPYELKELVKKVEELLSMN